MTSLRNLMKTAALMVGAVGILAGCATPYAGETAAAQRG